MVLGNYRDRVNHRSWSSCHSVSGEVDGKERGSSLSLEAHLRWRRPERLAHSSDFGTSGFAASLLFQGLPGDEDVWCPPLGMPPPMRDCNYQDFSRQDWGISDRRALQDPFQLSALWFLFLFSCFRFFLCFGFFFFFFFSFFSFSLFLSFFFCVQELKWLQQSCNIPSSPMVLFSLLPACLASLFWGGFVWLVMVGIFCCQLKAEYPPPHPI